MLEPSSIYGNYSGAHNLSSKIVVSILPTRGVVWQDII